MGDDVASRLRQEIAKRGVSIRRFQEELQAFAGEKGARGVSYASVHSYLAADAERRTEPPLGLIAIVAEFLGVRPAWLAYGDEPRTDEERSAESGRSPAQRQLARHVPNFDILPAAVQGAFFEAWARYTRGFKTEGGFTEDQLNSMATTLHRLVLFPLGFPGFRHSLSDEDLTDYVLLMLQALMHAMPQFRSGDPLGDHDKFEKRREVLLPGPENPKARPKVRRRRT